MKDDNALQDKNLGLEAFSLNCSQYPRLQHTQSEKIYSSEKFNDDKQCQLTSSVKITESQMLSNLNSSLDGLFSKIQALKGSCGGVSQLNEKKQNRQNKKFSPFPSFKSPKVSSTTQPFNQFFKKSSKTSKFKDGFLKSQRTQSENKSKLSNFIHNIEEVEEINFCNHKKYFKKEKNSKKQTQNFSNYQQNKSIQSENFNPNQYLFENKKQIKQISQQTKCQNLNFKVEEIKQINFTEKQKDICEEKRFKKKLNLQNIIIKEVAETNIVKKQQIHIKQHINLSIGDFELGKCVGSGKFGDVYVCRHKKTGGIFGIKKIFKSTILEYDMINQFSRELKIHYQLDHPNTVKLYTHFHDDYHVFLLMEYIEGGILMQKLKASEDIVSEYIDQTINGVQYMHKLNIAHRDIKPQNIVLQFNTVKLCDFGWSSSYNNQMKTTFCGTLDYLSPEMKDRGVYDNSVDIWAIGVLTFELLTGKPPFKLQLGEWKGRRDEKTNWQVKYPPLISTIAESFIRSILKENPNERVNLRACYNHLFLRKYRQNSENSKYFNQFSLVI